MSDIVNKLYEDIRISWPGEAKQKIEKALTAAFNAGLEAAADLSLNGKCHPDCGSMIHNNYCPNVYPWTAILGLRKPSPEVKA